MGPLAFWSVMHHLVECYGSDPSSTDAARVLRLPGFLHQKSENDGRKYLVRIVEASGKRYIRTELTRAFPATEASINSFHAKLKLDQSKSADVIFEHEEWDRAKERVGSALEYIPADDRDVWRHGVGAPLHHTSSGSEEAYAIFDAWSSKSRKYK